MRKVVVGAMVSMDGVMQAPGGPEEDPTGGFKFGGWVAPFVEVDPVFGQEVGKLFDQRLNPYFAKLAHYFENPETWSAALAEHRAIRDAIAARDPDAARETMREHLARSQARFAQNFGTEAASSSRVRTRSG